MKLARKASIIAVATAFAFTISAGAQTTSAPASHVRNGEVARTMDMLDHTHQFSEAVVSPDAARVAYVTHMDAAGGSEIYVRDLKSANGAPELVTAAAGSSHTEQDVAWSPDGKRLAFLSDAEHPGQMQLCIADTAAAVAMQPGQKRAAAVRCVTHLKGDLSAPRWSPDATRISFLFIENAPRASGPLAAETPDEGVVEDHPFEQRLAIVDLASQRVRQITPADTYIYEYDWSPDGKQFAATAAKGSGDDNWYIAQLFTIDGASGAMQAIYKPPVEIQMAEPRWSADGQSVAFIGGLMSDEGSTGGDIFVVPARGGNAQNVTPRLPSSPASITWLPGRNEILFAGHQGGGVNFGVVDPVNKTVRQIWRGDETLGASQFEFGFSVAHDGKTMAVVRQSYSDAPEVWVGEIGAWRKLTSMNAGHQPAWGKTESLTWTNGGMEIQGWLMYPANYDPAKKYPMVVSVHGGPASVVTPHWPSSGEFAVFLSPAEYFVLFPNPRGSYGRGEEFTRANVKDYGYGDFQDILAGVDAAVKHASIDEKRIGLTGWSYGGYMTMWGVTQTNRFRAAVSGAGLANWQSYYGENKIDKWMVPYFGASVYDDPAVYAKSSPITFIKNAKTPTLILVGDSDGECPPPQSYEFWHALKTLGVETQFVIYDHEGHRFVKPEHMRDRVERVTAWFDEHMN
jgi:dipeptidyl aminopeptidase/acylaminoacyl peptidase